MSTQNRRIGRFLAVLVIFSVWRGTLFMVDLVGESVSSERPGNPYKSPDVYPVSPNYWVDAWFRWDAGWYRRITDKGYFIPPGARQADVAFLPLFPYLARWLGAPIGNPYLAGLIISNVATLFALYFFYLVALELTDEKRARSALILTLVFPGSFFFSAFYAEGLFFLGATAMTWAYLKRRWVVAGFAGAVATLARPMGLALFAALCADYLWQLWKRRERFDWRSLALLLTPASLGIFFLMLWQQVGDPFAYSKFHAAGWGRKLTFPLVTIIDELRRFDWHFLRGNEKNYDLIELVFGVAFLAIGVWMALSRKHRAQPWAWLYVLLVVCMNFGSGKSQSMVRHTAVCYPAFLWLADLTEEHAWAQKWLITIFAMLLALFNLRYANWWWAG